MTLLDGSHSTAEFIDAQSHIWSHIFNFINSMSRKCTILLGIPDIIHKHGKPMMLSELTEALSIDGAKMLCIERLMRIMIHSNFFIKAKISTNDDIEGYWLTPSSLLLLRDEPLSVAPFVLAMLDPILMEPWHHLSKWFGTDHLTPFVTFHGTTTYEHAGRDASFNTIFNEGMASDSLFVSAIIVKGCRHVFDGLKSIVDVGGGTGTMVKALVDAFPGLKGIVLELPHVVASLEGTTDLTYVGGDMFESIPKADAVFMKWIMHNWPDEECVKILKNCREAIPNKENGGKVIIVDMVVDDNTKTKTDLRKTQLCFDMLMMTLISGKERSKKQWENLFFAAGFTSYKITNILGLRSLIEVFP